jgi:predicted DNA binding CopG/RHH family protein
MNDDTGPGDLEDLRDYYDHTDVADQFGDAQLDTGTTTQVMVSTSIRLPRSLMETVREQATDLGIPATTLIRRWVVEKATTPSTGAVVSVAELQRFIAEHNRPLAS